MGRIDLITQGTDGTVFLLLRHEPDLESLDELRLRIRNSVSYALDGYLDEAYPAVVGLPVSIRVDLPERPTGDLARDLADIRAWVTSQGIGLIVDVVPVRETGHHGSDR